MRPESQGADAVRTRAVVPVLSVLLVLAFVTLVRVNLVGIPFERDEGDYFYLGQLILDGKTPYVSFYEQKLPGLFYAYALIILAFGSTVEGAHLAFLVVNVITTIGIFFAARRLYGDLPAAVACATFAILALAPRLCGFTTQSEHLVALLVTAGILPMLQARPYPRRLHLFLSGPPSVLHF